MLHSPTPGLQGARRRRGTVTEGMLGLVDRRTTSVKSKHGYSDVVAGYILYLKQLYPAIHYREIARIIERKFGHKTHHLMPLAPCRSTAVETAIPCTQQWNGGR